MHQCCLLYSGIITLGTAFAMGLFIPYTTDPENDRWKCQSTQQEREREHQTIQNLVLGIAEGSCGSDETTDGNQSGSLTSGNLCRDRSSSDGGEREPSAVGSVRKRERAAEQLNLVVLEPGQHVGPYLLQEHLGYLGHRPVHDYDPAFHPHEAKRVGYHPREIISAPPRPPVSPVPPRSNQKNLEGVNGEVEGLVLKGGNEQNVREGSYRLKKRFEGGSHGEVWKGVRLGPDGEPTASGEGYILKRMLLEKGQHVLQAGIREIYFGELLTGRRGSPRVARYVEHLYLFGNYGRGRFGKEGERVREDGARAEEGDSWEAGAVPTEMWLVFRDEGLSLRHYLYTEREAEGFVLHGQSNFWRDMRLDPKGPEVMKSILRQILEGARFLHERGILHRDLKPSNLIVSLAPVVASPTANAPGDDPDLSPTSSTSRATTPERGWARSGGRRRGGHGNREEHEGSTESGGEQRSSSPKGSSSKGSPHVLLRVADFSSAVDEGSAGLYGAKGPVQEGEETLHYAPPEVLFDPETAYSSERPESYDIWSIGVILLELILGTPEVFTVDQRTRAILERDLAFEDDAARAKAHLLAAMADMCIYSRSGGHPGGGGGARSRRGRGRAEYSGHSESSGRAAGRSEGVGHWPLGDRAVVDERCTLAELGKAIHTRDALDVGFPDQWGLDLLWRLLRWDPLERISVADALEHAYFKGPYRSRRDGTAHATRSEAMAYDGWFTGSARMHPTAVAIRQRPPYAVLWGSTGGGGEEVFYDEGGVASTGTGISGKLVLAPMSGSTSVGEERSFTLDHQHTIDVQYTCPKCNRTFELWESCHNHVTGRHHASFCQYDAASLPPCVSSHSMLPFDPHSGWCDVQGRRSRIEDFHSIVFQEDYKFYGVFDGHCGTRAAKFASRALHLNLELFLNAPRGPDDTQDVDRNSFIERAVRAAFRKTQRDFLDLVGQHQDQHGVGAEAAAHGVHSRRLETAQSSRVYVSAKGPAAVAAPREAAPAVPAAAAAAAAEDDSGTTATVALVYPDITVVAHVGDSRAVMCCDDSGRAVEITEDHTPYSAGERARVEANGGSVEHRGVLRVNGELAVTRTLGNRRLSRDGVLSSEPDVVFVSRRGVDRVHASGELRGFRRDSGGVGGGGRAAFLVLASDGLWDVVSSQEAVDMVKEVIRGASPGYPPGVSMPKLVDVEVDERGARSSRDAVARDYGLYGPGQAFQVAATALTHEAYVRGSTDNIGVCVVDLRPH